MLRYSSGTLSIANFLSKKIIAVLAEIRGVVRFGVIPNSWGFRRQYVPVLLLRLYYVSIVILHLKALSFQRVWHCTGANPGQMDLLSSLLHQWMSKKLASIEQWVNH